jgi:hypothetical protein
VDERTLQQKLFVLAHIDCKIILCKPLEIITKMTIPPENGITFLGDNPKMVSCPVKNKTPYIPDLSSHNSSDFVPKSNVF